MSQVVTIRISDESKERLERLCEFTRRSKSFIAGEALEEYLVSKLWMMEALEQGIQDHQAGNLVSYEVVLSEWEGKASA